MREEEEGFVALGPAARHCAGRFGSSLAEPDIDVNIADSSVR
ncbi:hypothetical protein B8V81_0698 [Paenibacillus pasadenensis]|uniref:Uncharacterized protein n=1 Tax=Paenibacillus pasadenensis TaxID=217090 RepID=A0A2N5NBT0_9BACL|nr:hypothetical protein B8V81_0698 [Paenibacillus pasadenensis]